MPFLQNPRIRKLKTWQKIAGGLGLSLAIAMLLALGDWAYTAWAFDRAAKGLLFQPAPQVWSHRGLGGQHPEETLLAYEEALAHGAQGIELDLHYFPGQGFALAHNRPAQPELKLETVLHHFGRSTHYWLDFKRSEQSDLNQIAQELAQVVITAGVADLAVVESPDPQVLQAFHGQGLQTLLWIALYQNPSPWQRLQEEHKYRKWALRSGAVGFSGFRGKLPPHRLGFLAGWPLFVFDVGALIDTAPFCRLDHVQVFLSRSHDLFKAPCPAPVQ